MYAKAGQGGAAGADGGAAGGQTGNGPAGGEGKPKDDVVEAEFEEVKE
jgi:hypothetical protein